MGLKEIQQESSCLLPFYKEKNFYDLCLPWARYWILTPPHTPPI